MKSRVLAAEFLGTFVLCFAGIGAICSAAGGLVGIALAHGLAIVCMGSALGHISGGHFNPAVTFGFAVTKRLSWGDCIGYWMGQLAGALAGAFAVKFCFPEGQLGTLGIPALSGTVTLTQGAILELIGTFLLVLAVFGTAVDKRAPKCGALFIGLTLTAMILAFGPQTGTGINPARWFGPALIMNNWQNAIAFTVAPLLGGALAAVVYDKFLAPESEQG